MAGTPELVRPDSDLNFSFDWSSWLPDSVTIASRLWTVTPSGPTLANETTAAVRITGFTAGLVYRLRETVTLSDGQDDWRERVLRCQ